jgi:hypothetical protein
VPSEFLTDPETQLLSQSPFVLEPEQLPSLRRALELRIEAMRQAEQDATAKREGVERYLGDLEIAEKKLGEMGD